MPVEILTIVTDEGLYRGAGLVNRWFTRIGESMHRNIKEAAPVRTGELRAGIILDFTHRGLRIIESVVTTTAEHSIYVLKGTAGNGAGLIYSRRGWRNKASIGQIREFGPGGRGGVFPTGLWMKLSDARDGVHLVVHGQRANNFMAKGYDATARTHPSLRSFPHT